MLQTCVRCDSHYYEYLYAICHNADDIATLVRITTSAITGAFGV